MSVLGEVLVGLAVVIGLAGVVVQVYPGSLIVLAAVVIWGVVTGGAVGWTVAAVAVVAVAVAAVAEYVVAGRYLLRAGVPGRTLLIGGVVGVIGFFVIPVIGLPIGFVLAVYLVELARRRDTAVAWQATVAALKATGIGILVELAGSMVAAGAWVVGLVLT